MDCASTSAHRTPIQFNAATQTCTEMAARNENGICWLIPADDAFPSVFRIAADVVMRFRGTQTRLLFATVLFRFRHLFPNSAKVQRRSNMTPELNSKEKHTHSAKANSEHLGHINHIKKLTGC